MLQLMLEAQVTFGQYFPRTLGETGVGSSSMKYIRHLFNNYLKFRDSMREFICLRSVSKYSNQLMGLVYVKLSKLLCFLCRLSLDDFVFR